MNEREKPPESGDGSRSAANRITMMLALIAAILAFSAAAVQGMRKRVVPVAPIAAGVLMLALAMQARSRINPKR